MKRWLAFAAGAVLLAVLVFGSARGLARTDSLADDVVMLDSLSTAEKVGRLSFCWALKDPASTARTRLSASYAPVVSHFSPTQPQLTQRAP